MHFLSICVCFVYVVDCCRLSIHIDTICLFCRKKENEKFSRPQNLPKRGMLQRHERVKTTNNRVFRVSPIAHLACKLCVYSCTLRTFDCWLASGIDGDDEIVAALVCCCKHCWLPLRQPLAAAATRIACCLLPIAGGCCCCSLTASCDVDTTPPPIAGRSAVLLDCNEWPSLPVVAESIVPNRSLVWPIGGQCGRFGSLALC